jgi:hypothetical protein
MRTQENSARIREANKAWDGPRSEHTLFPRLSATVSTSPSRPDPMIDTRSTLATLFKRCPGTPRGGADASLSPYLVPFCVLSGHRPAVVLDHGHDRRGHDSRLSDVLDEGGHIHNQLSKLVLPSISSVALQTAVHERT